MEPRFEVAASKREPTPTDLREGVRAGILEGLQRDLSQRGGRTARRLAAAGIVGVPAAVGLVLLLSGHPYGHHPSWHAVVFGAVWTGLLVVCLSLLLLDVRTPSLPLARSAAIALLGLGLAGLCGAACPDPHFLAWWSSRGVGAWLTQRVGLAPSALCFGGVSALVIGLVAAGLALGAKRGGSTRTLLPAVMLFAVLAPGVALQSVGTSWPVFGSWLAGTAAGAYVGVAGASWTLARARRAAS